MVFKTLKLAGLAVAALQQLVSAVSVTDIQGPAYLSPLKGQKVQNLTGIVTAKVRFELTILFIETHLTLRLFFLSLIAASGFEAIPSMTSAFPTDCLSSPRLPLSWVLSKWET